MYPTVLFTLQNMATENQGLYVPFSYESNTTFTLQNMPSENQDLYVTFCYETRHCLYFAQYSLWKSRSISTGLLWHQTLRLVCKICPPKIKIYMYLFRMRADTAFTLQNIPSENQDLYVPFCYETGHCLYFPEYGLWKSWSICILLLWDRYFLYFVWYPIWKSRSTCTLLLWDWTLPILRKIYPLKINIYMYRFVIKPTMHLLCRICPQKLKVYNRGCLYFPEYFL